MLLFVYLKYNHSITLSNVLITTNKCINKNEWNKILKHELQKTLYK